MSSTLQTLTVYYNGPSPNPFKVALVLEELGLPWKFETVEREKLKEEPYVSINPNGRVPALVDPNKNITLWESGAIIDYLIAEYDPEAKLHYDSFPEKYTTRTWEHFQMSGQGPYFGQSGWFIMFHPEKVQSAIDRYGNEARRITAVVDSHLSKQGTGYLVGDRITYADLMWQPYFRSIKFFAPTVDMTEFPTLQAWMDRIAARPASAKVFDIHQKETIQHLENMQKDAGAN